MKSWIRMLLGLQLLCCLSACMGSDGMLVRFGSQAGVVRLDDGKQIVLRNGMRILAPQLDTLQIGEGDCCLVDFQLNYDNQPDSLQNIWHADWLTYRPVDLNALGTLVPDDTMTTRADEHFLRFSIAKGGCVEGRMFLYLEYNSHYSSQVDEFMMLCDPDPSVRHPAADDSARLVHQLYLRSFGPIAEGDSVVESLVLPEAFLIEELLERASSAGEDTLHFQITYPTGFNADSSRYNWGVSEVFSVPLSDSEGE